MGLTARFLVIVAEILQGGNAEIAGRKLPLVGIGACCDSIVRLAFWRPQNFSEATSDRGTLIAVISTNKSFALEDHAFDARVSFLSVRDLMGGATRSDRSCRGVSLARAHRLISSMPLLVVFRKSPLSRKQGRSGFHFAIIAFSL